MEHSHLEHGADYVVVGVEVVTGAGPSTITARREVILCAVRGIEGLRVADASIMPAIAGGNTNAPAMMIGEHCAQLMTRG